jgi:hypothetical protein
MQPDTNRRIIPRSSLITPTSCRVSEFIRSHCVMEAAPVSLSNIPSVLLALTMFVTLTGCWPAPSEEASRTDKTVTSR